MAAGLRPLVASHRRLVAGRRPLVTGRRVLAAAPSLRWCCGPLVTKVLSLSEAWVSTLEVLVSQHCSIASAR